MIASLRSVTHVLPHIALNKEICMVKSDVSGERVDNSFTRKGYKDFE